jgi:Na+-translocating ferredoxin:NAD+ oxidoreductase RnfD subunit
MKKDGRPYLLVMSFILAVLPAIINQFHFIGADFLNQIFLTLIFPVLGIILSMVSLNKNFKLGLLALILNSLVFLFMFYSLYLAI